MTPIQRFCDFESAREALWLEPGDPRLLERIRCDWELGRRLPKNPPPRGMWFSRSMEEANAHREAWTAERIERLAAEREAEREAERGAQFGAECAAERGTTTDAPDHGTE